MEQLTERQTGYLGSAFSYEEAKIIMVGIPMDFTVSYRAGSRMGPQQIRNVSPVLEEYSPFLDRSLDEVKFFDWGDVVLPFGNVGESLARIRGAAEKILEDEKFPLFLGGEHLVTLPIVEAVAAKYPSLRVIHFDAHADLREDYLGEEMSHATVMGKIAKLLGGDRIYQFGIRSGTKEEFLYGRNNTNFFPGEVLAPLRDTIPRLAGFPVYVTLDIDVVDPAFAPGTGTPEPGGCDSREILQAVYELRGLNVVGFDLVEVLPQLDASDRTAILAAKIVREVLLTFG